MATFTTIADTVLEPGKPIRSVDTLALRDNPIAIAGGAAGAPRVVTNAIQDGAVTPAKLLPPTAGDNIILRLQEGEISTRSTTYRDVAFNRFFAAQTHIGCTVLIPGTVRVTAQHRTGSAGDPAMMRILKNGAQLQEFTTTSSSYTTRTLDVQVAVGDVIIFQQRSDFNFVDVFWRSLRVLSGNITPAVA